MIHWFRDKREEEWMAGSEARGKKGTMNDFLALLPRSLKNFEGCRRQSQNVLSAFADSSKKRFLSAVSDSAPRFSALLAISL
jgi:hypothetical protein